MQVMNINGANSDLINNVQAYSQSLRLTENPLQKTVLADGDSDKSGLASQSSKDTLSVSDDGDTLEASKESIISASLDAKVLLASDDGTVTENEESLMSASEDDKMVDDLTGMTKTQVEMLYRQGRVSYRDYEENLEEREEREEALSGDSKEVDASTAAAGVTASSKEDKSTYAANDVKEDVSNNLSDEDNKDMLQNNDDDDDDRKQLITDEKQSISEFDNDFAKLSYISQATDMENIALNTAIDNNSFENIQKLGLI